MVDNSWDAPDKEASKDEVAFDYIKADNFRTIWADGVIGGITPRGHIHFAPYVERNAIPRRQVYAIEEMKGNIGKLGGEIIEKGITRNSVVREMSVDLVMSPQQAEATANWLLQRVAEIREEEK